MSTYNSRAAVQSIMAIAESENSKPGRVTMPKVFLGVGIFDVIAMGVGIYFSLRFKEIIPAVIFSILALLGIFLIIGYFNQRIYYSADKFVSSNLWGVKRTYSYGDISGIMGYGRNTDVKIYIGDKKIAIDRMAVGKKEFIEFALKRHRELKHKNIPLLRAAKKEDLFNGNIANPGEFIAVYIIIAIGAALLFGIMLFVEFRPQTPETDLRYSTVAFNSCEVYGDELWLRTGGDMDYKIAHYDEMLPDVDAFLAKIQKRRRFETRLSVGQPEIRPRLLQSILRPGRSERDVRNAGEGVRSPRTPHKRGAPENHRAFLGAHALPAEHHTGKHLRRSARGHAEPENSPHLLQARLYSLFGSFRAEEKKTRKEIKSQ